MRMYFEPEMKISVFDMENVITASAAADSELKGAVSTTGNYITTRSLSEIKDSILEYH